MFCNNCGKKIIKDSIYCEYCGVSVFDEAPKNKISKKYFNKFQKTFFKKTYKIILKNTFAILLGISIITSVFVGYRYYIKTQQSLTETHQALLQLKETKTATPQSNKIESTANIKTAVSPIEKKLTNQEIIKKVKPAVVFIVAGDSKGSGMIIENNGLILTNAHVVSDADSAIIKLTDGKSFTATVVSKNEGVDLALLKINATNLPTVELGNSDKLAQGDNVFAMGYPFGLEGDVDFKEGTISRRFTDQGMVYLETSAAIYPGNSGGPLVNQFGQVIGINTATFGRSIQGISVGETIKLAIPINFAKSILSSLKSGSTTMNLSGSDLAGSISTPIVRDPRYFEFMGNGFCDNNPGVSAIIVGSYEIPQNNIICWSDTKVCFNAPASIPRGQYPVTIRGYKMGVGYCSGVSAGLTIY